MIEKMTKYSFVLLSGDKEVFLEKLRDLGVVDITRSSKPVDAASQELVARINGLKDEIHTIRSGSDPTLAALLSEREALAKAEESMAPWGDYDRSKASAIGEAGLPLHFYSVRKKEFKEEWKALYPLEIIYEDGKKVHFVVVGSTDGLPVKEMKSPDATVSEIKAKAEAKDKEIEKYRKRLEARTKEIPALETEIKELGDSLNLHLASVAGEQAVEDRLTVFEGFAPSGDDGRLSEAFDALDAVWISSDASIEDNPPIKLRNNRFVSMFEVLTDMYGRPRYDGFDPTPFISFFFMLFFAMCMGDAGYGLVLIAAGLVMKKSSGMSKLAPLVTTLGIATFIIGFLFHTFFSVDIASWNCIPGFLKKCMVPSKVGTYDGTMVLALVIGIIHLCLAMLVKTWNVTRNQGFANSLGTWGWTLLIVGGVVVAAIALMGVIDAKATKIIVIILGVISATGIFLLNNLHRNPLLNIGSGLWETYNTVTGLLGDVLSYLRLYALGLAGAMLGFAFNDLAKMALGDGGIRWIFFILIVVMGHTLNLAMCALGAFVHPLRLNFLEFFKNSGYETSNRNYSPLRKQ